MKTYNIFYLFIILILGIYACGDDGGPTGPTIPTDTTTVETEDSVTIDIVTQDWQVDETTADTTQLNSQNVQVSFTEGMEYTLIIPGFSGVETTGNWSFNDDKTAIILDDGNIKVTATIVSISETNMVLEFEYDNFKGNSVTYRITLNT